MSQGEEEGGGNEVHLGLPCGRQKGAQEKTQISVAVFHFLLEMGWTSLQLLLKNWLVKIPHQVLFFSVLS